SGYGREDYAAVAKIWDDWGKPAVPADGSKTNSLEVKTGSETQFPIPFSYSLRCTLTCRYRPERSAPSTWRALPSHSDLSPTRNAAPQSALACRRTPWLLDCSGW